MPDALPPTQPAFLEAPVRDAVQERKTSGGREPVGGSLGLLVVRSGPREGDIFKLDRPRSIVGRSLGVDVLVDDRHVSALHASIRCEHRPAGGSYAFVIRDLDSRNGTKVNGEAVAGELALSDGDVIRVGTTDLVFKRL